MPDRIAESADRIDPQASKEVAKAIGERLQTDLRLEGSELPFRLQVLLQQLSAQDDHG